MKLRNKISRSRARGISLIECLVYIAVFAILLNIGGAAFYFCWDHTRATIYASDDIGAALRAGERWRADVRAATGKISIETSATNETVKIPEGEKEIIYRFESGEMRREIPPQKISQPLLKKVKASEMTNENRGGVNAWRWELELTERRKETHLPLRFTFETAQFQP